MVFAMHRARIEEILVGVIKIFGPIWDMSIVST